MDNTLLIEALDKTIATAQKEYDSICAYANWFNNNMPNVGITIDYKPVPPEPESLIQLKKLREQLI